MRAGSGGGVCELISYKTHLTHRQTGFLKRLQLYQVTRRALSMKHEHTSLEPHIYSRARSLTPGSNTHKIKTVLIRTCLVHVHAMVYLKTPKTLREKQGNRWICSPLYLCDGKQSASCTCDNRTHTHHITLTVPKRNTKLFICSLCSPLLYLLTDLILSSLFVSKQVN